MAVYPEIYLKDVFVQTKVDNDSLIVDLFIHNSSAETRTVDIASQLSSWNDTPWVYPEIENKKVKIEGNSIKKYTVNRKWGLSSDSYWWPNIPFKEDYTAQLHFINFKIIEGNNIIHTTKQRFGFHEYSEGPYYYLINNVRITGISDGTAENQMSSYDTYSTSPAFLPPSDSTKGAPETWKKYQRIGINTNRLHYSMPTEYMMDVADELGFMIIPEAPIWGNFISKYDSVFTPQVVREMARLCRNHPSVI